MPLSQEVVDTIWIMSLFILGGAVQFLFMYVIDKFREKGPAHYLGMGLMRAYAWDMGDALHSGHVAGLPVTTKQLSELTERRKADRPLYGGERYQVHAEQQALLSEIEEVKAGKRSLDEVIQKYNLLNPESSE